MRLLKRRNTEFEIELERALLMVPIPPAPLGTITLGMMSDVDSETVFYRKSSGTGSPEVQSLSTLKVDLGLSGNNSGDQTSITGITGTLAQFNVALLDADFVTGGGTATGINTEDETSTSIKTKLGISTLSGANTGDETNSSIATIINSATIDTAVEETDYIPIVLETTSVLKRFSWSYVKSTLKTYFDTLYGALASANVWSAFQKFTVGTNVINGSYRYFGANATADTVNDIRIGNSSGALFTQTCTISNVTKGTGTWVTGTSYAKLKRSIYSISTTSTLTPVITTYDTCKLTAQAATLVIANPTGTPFDMQELLIYIKDNGIVRAVSFGTSYNGVMSVLPTTTTAGKQMILYFVYNSTTVKWELINKSTGV